MSTTTMTDYMHPTIEVTERTDGHFMPFVVAMLMLVIAASTFIAISGLPF